MTTHIAVRLAAGRIRRSAGLTLFTIVALAVATVTVLMVASAENAVAARGAREAQRHHPTASPNIPSPGTLVAFTETLIAGRQVTVVELAATGLEAPAPVGLDTVPPAGTVVVSPALADAILASPDLGVALGRITGDHVAPAGLVEPDELVAYRGWRPDVLSRIAAVVEVDRFPLLADADAWWMSKVAVRLGMLLLAAGLVVPALLLVGVLARLALTQRRRHVAGLRLVGATETQTAAVVAVEAGLAGLVGAVIGTVAFFTIRPAIATIPVGGAAWFPSDITPPLWAIVGVVVAVPVLAAISALIAARQAIVSPLPVFSRAAVSRLRPVTALAAIGASAACLAAVATFGEPGSPIFLGAALIGVSVTMVSLPLVGPTVLAAVSRMVARSTGSPALLLAAKTTSWDPNAAFRPSIGLMVAVMFMTMINGYATGNITETSPDWYNGHADITVATPTGDPMVVAAFLGTLASRSPTSVRLPIRQATDGSTGLSVAVADCQAINDMGIARAHECSANDVFLAPTAQETQVTELHIAGVHLTVAPSTTGSLREEPGSCCLGADVLVSPQALPGAVVQALPARRILIATSGQESREAVRLAALQHLPGARITTLADLTAAINQPVREARRIVNGAAVLALLLATTSLIAAAVGRHLDRASTYMRLRAAGTPVSMLAKAVYAETCASLLTAVALGTVAGMAVSKALVTVLDGHFAPSVSALFLVPAGAFALAALVTSAMMLPLSRGTHPERLQPP